MFLHPVKYTNLALLLQYVHFVYSSSEIHKLCCPNVLHVVFLHFKTKMAFLRFNMYALCVFIAHRLCIPPVSSSRQKLTDASAPKCIIALLPATTSSTSTSHRYHQHHQRHHHLSYIIKCVNSLPEVSEYYFFDRIRIKILFGIRILNSN